MKMEIYTLRINKYKAHSFFKVIAIVLVALTGIIGIYTRRGLYADGSLYLYNILINNGFWVFDPPRSIVQFFTQIPVVLLIKIGVTSIETLILFHSVGLILPLILTWIALLILSFNSRYFWYYLVTFSITYLASGFMAIGEYNLTYTLTTFCLAIMLRENNTPILWMTSIFASIILLRSYESMLILGPILFAYALYRLIKSRGNKKTENKYILILTILFFSASLLSVLSIINFRDPNNLKSAGSMSIIFSRQFIFLFSMLLAYIVLQVIPNRRIVNIISIFGSLVSLFFFMTPIFWITPTMNYQFRTTTGLLLFLIYSFLIIEWIYRNGEWESNFDVTGLSKSSSVFAFILFISLIIPLNSYSIEFNSWLNDFEKTARLVENWVPVDETDVYLDLTKYDLYSWSWSNPSLSIILRGNSDGGILNESNYNGWEPFVPQEFKTNPLLKYDME